MQRLKLSIEQDVASIEEKRRELRRKKIALSVLEQLGENPKACNRWRPFIFEVATWKFGTTKTHFWELSKAEFTLLAYCCGKQNLQGLHKYGIHPTLLEELEKCPVPDGAERAILGALTGSEFAKAYLNSGEEELHSVVRSRKRRRDSDEVNIPGYASGNPAVRQRSIEDVECEPARSPGEANPKDRADTAGRNSRALTCLPTDPAPEQPSLGAGESPLAEQPFPCQVCGLVQNTGASGLVWSPQPCQAAGQEHASTEPHTGDNRSGRPPGLHCQPAHRTQQIAAVEAPRAQVMAHKSDNSSRSPCARGSMPPPSPGRAVAHLPNPETAGRTTRLEMPSAAELGTMAPLPDPRLQTRGRHRGGHRGSQRQPPEAHPPRQQIPSIPRRMSNASPARPFIIAMKSSRKRNICVFLEGSPLLDAVAEALGWTTEGDRTLNFLAMTSEIRLWVVMHVGKAKQLSEFVEDESLWRQWAAEATNRFSGRTIEFGLVMLLSRSNHTCRVPDMISGGYGSRTKIQLALKDSKLLEAMQRAVGWNSKYDEIAVASAVGECVRMRLGEAKVLDEFVKDKDSWHQWADEAKNKFPGLRVEFSVSMLVSFERENSKQCPELFR